MKHIILIAVVIVFALVGLFAYQYATFHDGKLHVIFCDVGQGDAILVKTPAGKFILADGGPDKSVLSCLSRHMPFWQRALDLVLLSHPHLDHFYGLNYVVDRYSILSFATENLDNQTASFQGFKHLLFEKHISQTIVLADDSWKFADGVVLTIVSPSEEFLAETSPNGVIGESREFASLITHISYGSFDVLLTGDSQAGEVQRVGDALIQKLDILQVPHHGSATGLTATALQALNPTMAAISVGENNRYGHPKEQVLQLLKRQGTKVVRTDVSGDIEIVSDGSSWNLQR